MTLVGLEATRHNATKVERPVAFRLQEQHKLGERLFLGGPVSNSFKVFRRVLQPQKSVSTKYETFADHPPRVKAKEKSGSQGFLHVIQLRPGQERKVIEVEIYLAVSMACHSSPSTARHVGQIITIKSSMVVGEATDIDSH